MMLSNLGRREEALIAKAFLKYEGHLEKLLPPVKRHGFACK
jgi:hypothetical protein